MAKINNLQVYPFTNDLDVRDHVIGTDWNDMKRTKNFPIKNIGLALGMAGVRVEEVYLGFAPISINDVPLSEQVQAMLDVHTLEVDFNTLIILKVLYHDTIVPDGAIARIYPKQINYYFPKGQGLHEPISSVCNFEDLIVDYEKSITISEEDITSSPDAEVIQLGDLSSVDDFNLIEYLNTNGDLYAIDDEEKSYYFRFSIDETSYLYFFNVASSANGYGIYGLANSQFSEEELILLYDSTIGMLSPGDYVQKAEFFQKLISGTGSVSVVLDTQETNFRIVSDDITMIEGTSPTTGYLSQYLREDKLLTFINKTANPIVFKHSLEANNFRFPNGANLTVQPNELIRFRLAKDDVSPCYEFDSLSRVGSGSTTTPTLQEVTEVGAETTVKTIFRQSETEWVEIGGDNNGIAVFNDEFGSLPTPKRIIDIAYNGLGINRYDTDTGELTGFAGIGDKTLIAGEIVGGVQGKTTSITPDKIVKRINATTSFDSFLPSEDNDLNGSKVISTNTTAKNAINYLAVANLTMTDITPPSEGVFYEVTVINGTATIGGVGYTVGQKVFRHYHSGSWRTFVYLDKLIIDTLLANKIDYLIKDFTFSPVTGVTTETLVESYEITAGKIGLNDFLNGFIYTTRTGLANAYTVTLKANTVNNSSTATTIASVATLGNFAPLTPMKFELTVKGGVIIGAIMEQSQGTNYRGQLSGINVSFDNSSNSVYLFLFVTPTNTSSVVQVQSFKLTK